jgi:acyl dehydratase
MMQSWIAGSSPAMTEREAALTPVASRDRYFEDYIPGTIFEYGETRVDEAEILEFARRFDPQGMHVDPRRQSAAALGG